MARAFAIAWQRSYMEDAQAIYYPQSNLMIPEQKPFHEPEIIPPGHANRASMRRAYRFVHPHGVHRIYAMQVGPFGLVLLAVVAALVAALMFLAILGAVLLWIPLVILLVAAAAISGLLRRQRPTHWR